ncbi:MAG: ATP-dependent helicase [Acholeplasmatales bacterium]|nr:ATP-dependent helicase [Acholeplasmatales bacterium]
MESLNKEQLRAVTTTSPKVLVIAGAGAGKTKVLTERIKHLIDNGVNPEEIIAFTFTNRAVKEMIYRLKDYKFENVYTFHKYSFSILSRYKDEIGYVKKKRINIVDDEYQYVLLEEILNDLNSPYNQRFIKDYISKRKNNISYKYKNTEEAGILNNIFFKYQSLLSQREMLDFDDMVSMLVNNIDNLKHKDDILNHCKYILVDEFQDTNKIQYDLLTKLSSKYYNLFCVGDEDQLVYSFRSSDIEIINNFKIIADEVIVLNQNYRCATNILNLANRLISHNTNRLEKELFSEINPKFKIKCDDYENTNLEAAYIASKIEMLINKCGYKPNEIAVLFRNNSGSLKIEYALKKLNIPFTTYGKLKFYKHEKIKRLIAFYRFLENPDDYILYRQAIPIDEAIYQYLIPEYKSSNKRFIDYLVDSKYEQLKPLAIKVKELLSNKSKYDKSKLFDIILKLLFNDSYNGEKNYLIEFKDLLVNNELEHEIDIINELMLDDGTFNKNEMGVNLLTIHKAKGLEFKCVFIISLNDGILPSNLNDNNLIEEERRLLYGAQRLQEIGTCQRICSVNF